MISKSLSALPIIDISPWVRPASEGHRGHNGGRWSTAAALHAACLTYGFFYLDLSGCGRSKEEGKEKGGKEEEIWREGEGEELAELAR